MDFETWICNDKLPEPTDEGYERYMEYLKSVEFLNSLYEEITKIFKDNKATEYQAMEVLELMIRQYRFIIEEKKKRGLI